MKTLIVGTGGHVDHGKSSLVQALTGHDPDRLAEEKRRGITIELGFSHFQINEEWRIGLIDVPGHEKFVRTMISGVAAIDVFLLVVAADDAVMPQTREHLDICRLLGVQQGIVALSKVDAVSDELRELAQADIAELLEGSFLQNAPVVEISSITGEGLDKLSKEILLLATQKKKKNVKAGFRLAVDRIFPLKGFGLIAAGVVATGQAAINDHLFLHPPGKKVRIKNIHSYHESVNVCEAGNRAALNIAGVDLDELSGGVQLASEGVLISTGVILVCVTLLEEYEKWFVHRSEIQFYSGTLTCRTRVYRLLPENKEEKTLFAQFRFNSPISCQYGDTFILRAGSPFRCIGGGQIISPFGQLLRRQKKRLSILLERLTSEKLSLRIEENIYLSGTAGVRAKDLPAMTGSALPKIKDILGKMTLDNTIVRLSKSTSPRYLHPDQAHRIMLFLAKETKKYHEQNPETAGIPATDLTGKIQKLLTSEEIATIIERAIAEGILKKISQKTIAHPKFSAVFNTERSNLKAKVIDLIENHGRTPPPLETLSQTLQVGRKELEIAIKQAEQEKKLIRLTKDTWCSALAIVEIEQTLVQYIHEHGSIDIGTAKENLNLSRKHALAFLEYFDAKRVTHRLGNKRVLAMSNT